MASARAFFDEAIVIDGLDTSKWGREGVYRTLRDGGVTAINATIAIWDDYDAKSGVLVSTLIWRFSTSLVPSLSSVERRLVQAE